MFYVYGDHSGVGFFNLKIFINETTKPLLRHLCFYLVLI